MEHEDQTGSSAEKPDGRPFGRYRLLRELGRGAQGVVYLAADEQLGRNVALKMLAGSAAPSGEARRRFLREAELASKLEHPGICGVHEVGEVDGLPFISMQLVPGTTLADLHEDARKRQTESEQSARPTRSIETVTITTRPGSGGMDDILRLMERAARALHVAHEASLVHRDVKPGNLMVTPDGDPVFLDFGLARDVSGEGQTLTQSGQIMGTPAYLAPEQIQGDPAGIDARTDVYGLGVTLFECLTLRRPYEAQTWDQLFKKILDGVVPNVREVNPRIPQDLRTVVEVAMDPKRERRYQSAADLAEDLRRIRAFEPILAKAAGPWARLLKWSHRNAGKAASLAATVLFVLVAIAVLVASSVSRANAVRSAFATAHDCLAAGDFDAALEAIGRAIERDPDSTEALALRATIRAESERADRERRRAAAIERAAAARDEAARKIERWQAETAAIREQDFELLRQTSGWASRWVDPERRAFAARREQEINAQRIAAEALISEAQEALEQAARFESPWEDLGAETDAVFADLYVLRWRAALEDGDSDRASWFRTQAEEHDRAGRHGAELDGWGSLTIDVLPSGAEVHLFRYEALSRLAGEDVVPRLVPVPTPGVGRSMWPGGLEPGTTCLQVVGVEPDSRAARCGIAPGDLVLRVAGAPSGSGLLVASVSAGTPVEAAGVRPLARILAIGDTPVDGGYEWTNVSRPGDDTFDLLTFEGVGERVAVDRRDVPITRPIDVVNGPAPCDVRLVCMRSGVEVRLDVPAGEHSGLTAETTAYPLIASPVNRIGNGTQVAADPGSYLVVARAPGFETLRLHVVVPRGGEVVAQGALLPKGATPTGYVYIPPGPFQMAGDREAYDPGVPVEVDVPGYFIGRFEVRNRDYYDFLNDPDTRVAIEGAKPETILLPRSLDGWVGARWSEDVSAYVWTRGGPDTPVLGVSHADVEAYLRWRNRKAAAEGDRFRYELPTEIEWEKAARGVDGRKFPWGDRFDLALATTAHRKPSWLIDASAGFEPCDESPYGVRDMAGSREEWTSDAHEDTSQSNWRKRGGHWQSNNEVSFRCASRFYANEVNASSRTGFRLVARPRD